MAKAIDSEKIKRIEKSAINLIVQKGYTSATISEIAKDANVSHGYVYSFYPDKKSLIQELYTRNIQRFNDHMYDEIKNKKYLSEILESGIAWCLKLLQDDPNMCRFLFMMIHDHIFELTPERRKKVQQLSYTLLKIGQFNGEISKVKTPEDLWVAYYGIMHKFIDARIRNHFGKTTVKLSEAKKLTKMCLDALSS